MELLDGPVTKIVKQTCREILQFDNSFSPREKMNMFSLCLTQ